MLNTVGLRIIMILICYFTKKEGGTTTACQRTYTQWRSTDVICFLPPAAWAVTTSGDSQLSYFNSVHSSRRSRIFLKRGPLSFEVPSRRDSVFRRGGPGLQKAGSTRNFALITHFYMFCLSQRGGPPGPPPESATAFIIRHTGRTGWWLESGWFMWKHDIYI